MGVLPDQVRLAEADRAVAEQEVEYKRLSAVVADADQVRDRALHCAPGPGWWFQAEVHPVSCLRTCHLVERRQPAGACCWCASLACRCGEVMHVSRRLLLKRCHADIRSFRCWHRCACWQHHSPVIPDKRCTMLGCALGCWVNSRHMKHVSPAPTPPQERARLRKAVDAAVADRDALGAQLVRRNDELALLHEKIRGQRATLERGNAAYRCALRPCCRKACWKDLVSQVPDASQPHSPTLPQLCC